MVLSKHKLKGDRKMITKKEIKTIKSHPAYDLAAVNDICADCTLLPLRGNQFMIVNCVDYMASLESRRGSLSEILDLLHRKEAVWYLEGL